MSKKMKQVYRDKLNNINDKNKRLNSIKQLIKDKKHSKALSELNNYLEDYKNDYFAMFLKGTLLESGQNLDEALYYFNKVAASNSNNKYSALVEIGKIKEKQQKIEEAEMYYTEAIENSNYTENYAIISLARIKRINEEYDKSLELLKKLDLSWSDRANIDKSKVYRFMEDYDKSLKALNEVSDYNKKLNREKKLELIRINALQEKYEEAYKIIEEIKNSDIKDSVYYKSLNEEAKILFKKEQYKEAKILAEQLYYTYKPLEKDSALILGKIKFNNNEIEEAKKYFKESVKSYSPNIRRESAFPLGDIYLEEMNYNKAEESYKIAARRNPVFVKSIYYKLVALNIRKNNYLEADKYLNIIVNNLPNEIYDQGYKNIRLLVDKELNKDISKYKAKTYIEKQIIDYSEIEAYKHIINNHGDINDESIILFETIKEKFKDEYKVQEEMLDVYDIPYDIKGYDNHRLRVVVIPNTNNIITMYPSDKKSLKDYIVKKETKKNNKQMSRIDKFNQKFAKFNQNK